MRAGLERLEGELGAGVAVGRELADHGEAVVLLQHEHAAARPGGEDDDPHDGVDQVLEPELGGERLRGAQDAAEVEFGLGGGGDGRRRRLDRGDVRQVPAEQRRLGMRPPAGVALAGVAQQHLTDAGPGRAR